MNSLFSVELRALVSRSRETAIDMGYGYISTLHFFIADCENENTNSILKFGFTTDDEFKTFKEHCKLKQEDRLDYDQLSLPLTKEAETTIRLTDIERIGHKQELIYPCHFFLAALKNKDSSLFQCFKNEENPYNRLTNYYDNLHEFEKSSMTDKEISDQYYNSNDKSGSGILNRLSRLFRKKQ